MREGELLLENGLANERLLVTDDPLFSMEVVVGDRTLLEDKILVNDWVLLVIDEILLEVDDWSVEDVAPADSEYR